MLGSKELGDDDVMGWAGLTDGAAVALINRAVPLP